MTRLTHWKMALVCCIGIPINHRTNTTALAVPSFVLRWGVDAEAEETTPSLEGAVPEMALSPVLVENLEIRGKPVLLSPFLGYLVRRFMVGQSRACLTHIH